MVTSTAISQLDKSKRTILVGGLLLFFILLAMPTPDSLSDQGWKVVAIAVLMLCWWVGEAVPIPVTAMLPIVLFPVLDVMPIAKVTTSYGHPIVFLFMGGFILALAMERWRLHLRIALSIIRLTGTSANGIIAGFMLATAFLSMWMSNTATTVMMLPIALSVIQLLFGQNDASLKQATPQQKRFALSLMLAVAFAANIGGTATLTGTPPNAIFAGALSSQFGYDISFADWMLIGVPFASVLLALCWIILVHVVYPSRLGNIEGADEMLEKQWQSLGKMSRQEKFVLIIFSGTALLWIFKSALVSLLNDMFALQLNQKNFTDTGVAMFAALLLFILPLDRRCSQFILKWEDMKNFPWGILLLFGGGLSLAGAMGKSGLVDVVGGQIAPLAEHGVLILVFAIVLVVLMFTECMSNLALITIFLPVLFGIALDIGEDPLLLAIPATLAASCAFMLPMATPPNAIVFASGHIRMPQMVRVGIVLNIIAVLLIVTFMPTLVAWVFGVEQGVVPSWASAGD